MTVTDKTLASVELTVDKTELTPGKTAKLSVKGKLADGTAVDLTDARIEYASASPDVATVGTDGVITAGANSEARKSAPR
ncbi:Ig-like domain-containing protein [Paenibacillus sp. CC-CFT747]|nr:Ig-like domain-containing protein [Paenibacillus sp. CC-CFT747]